MTLPPNGNNGIAAKYPGDVGIDQDPEVLFSDSFESYSAASDLRKKWDAARHESSTRISCEGENVHSGEKALEFTVPRRETELSNTVIKELEEEVDILFLRYYSKFEGGFDQTRSSHNGGHISGHYYSDGRATPGKPAVTGTTSSWPILRTGGEMKVFHRQVSWLFIVITRSSEANLAIIFTRPAKCCHFRIERIHSDPSSFPVPM